MSELNAFQASFLHTLFDRADSPDEHVRRLGPGWLVYRNTIFKSLVDAVQANFPTVARLVGVDWFRACALEFARNHPPGSAALVRYGEAFPSFLEQFPPASELPYLPDTARLDWLWVESHTARDVDALTASSVSTFSAEQLLDARLSLHPATRFALVRHSAATIWIHHRRTPSDADMLEVDGLDERILLTRAHGAVEFMPIERGAFELLQDLQAGRSVGEALSSALATGDGERSLQQLIQLIQCGAFAA